ncbi:21589_t:CDS:2 [Dentiscutata erythropus]|uniref:21589_t:CDS:1 n=1 Tax=Dentiscutata erythropus TaxID=1348616 RepID=A0A9N9P8L1_9GLOM|nr:21589_t:CDS:2 [Dentiscutata erythropus]
MTKRFLRSDATPLSDDNIRDIINAKNSMKCASEVMAKKYKISSRRVYQIWRNQEYPTDHIYQIQNKQNINWDKEIDDIYNLYREEANRVLWDQPIPHSYSPYLRSNTQSAQVQSNISRHEVTDSVKKSSTSSIDNTSKRKTDLEKLMKDTDRLAPINPSLSQ